MNISKIQYTLSQKSLDIYVSGCHGPHCEGCHNESLWDFSCGELYDENYFQKIQLKVKDFDNMIDKIMIFGGDLMHQKYEDIVEFLLDMRIFKKEIWVFTGESFSNIPEEIAILCDYIKCGKYKKDFIVDNNIQYGISLATSNQRIYKRGADF